MAAYDFNFFLSASPDPEVNQRRQGGYFVAVSIQSIEVHIMLVLLVPTTRNGKGTKLSAGDFCCVSLPMGHLEH